MVDNLGPLSIRDLAVAVDYLDSKSSHTTNRTMAQAIQVVLKALKDAQDELEMARSNQATTKASGVGSGELLLLKQRIKCLTDQAENDLKVNNGNVSHRVYMSPRYILQVLAGNYDRLIQRVYSKEQSNSEAPQSLGPGSDEPGITI